MQLVPSLPEGTQGASLWTLAPGVHCPRCQILGRWTPTVPRCWRPSRPGHGRMKDQAAALSRIPPIQSANTILPVGDSWGSPWAPGSCSFPSICPVKSTPRVFPQSLRNSSGTRTDCWHPLLARCSSPAALSPGSALVVVASRPPPLPLRGGGAADGTGPPSPVLKAKLPRGAARLCFFPVPL